MIEPEKAHIGEPEEVMYAVRFNPTFSYAITFHKTDPFYVLDLEPGQSPAVTGMMKLQRYYKYLQPMNDMQTIFVGIGQNTTLSAWGNPGDNGLMITVFDTTDPGNPTAIASRMFEDHSNDGDSFSQAKSESKAVQYIDEKLIIPVAFYHQSGDLEKQFLGFIVYELSVAAEKGIMEVFRVSHPDPNGGRTQKSFPYHGDKLMPLGNGRVVSSNVNT
jgi:Beta propeller domain